MSSWWFHTKLRRRSKQRAGAGAIARADPGPAPDDATPAPPPCSPNRASYYVSTRDRALPRRPANPRLRDTSFPRSPQPGDIVFDVVGGDRSTSKAAPPAGLRLRPILTRPRADDNDGGAASPTARARPRLHARAPKPSRWRKAEEEEESRGSRRRRRRRPACSRLRWVYESLVVVKESADPEEDFLASMADMIAANDAVRSPRGLEDLLACYLALNATEHHRAIVAAFRRAWMHHLHPAPPPLPTRGRRCLHGS